MEIIEKFNNNLSIECQQFIECLPKTDSNTPLDVYVFVDYYLILNFKQLRFKLNFKFIKLYIYKIEAIIKYSSLYQSEY